MMKDYKKYISALRNCAKEHENDGTFTGHVIVSDLCRDTANLLEELEQEPTVAQERYEDLCEYFGGVKDILNNREHFKAWLARVKWHIRKAEELYEKCEKEPCENAISRQAAIDYCYQLINVEHQQGSDEMNYGQERVNQTETILHHLEFMPSVRPEQKTGHWINNHNGTYTCDKCGGKHSRSKYCPNCGVKMVESEDN